MGLVLGWVAFLGAFGLIIAVILKLRSPNGGGGSANGWIGGGGFGGGGDWGGGDCGGGDGGGGGGGDC